MTYTELVQKIRDYTEVTSTVLTDTIVNGFIENAEIRILRDVDSDNNRRYVTAQLIAGTRFIDTNSYSFDFGSSATLTGNSGGMTVTAGPVTLTP